VALLKQYLLQSGEHYFDQLNLIISIHARDCFCDRTGNFFQVDLLYFNNTTQVPTKRSNDTELCFRGSLATLSECFDKFGKLFEPFS
jgi:hypothetical protein